MQMSTMLGILVLMAIHYYFSTYPNKTLHIYYKFIDLALYGLMIFFTICLKKVKKNIVDAFIGIINDTNWGIYLENRVSQSKT